MIPACSIAMVVQQKPCVSGTLDMCVMHPTNDARSYTEHAPTDVMMSPACRWPSNGEPGSTSSTTAP